MQSGTLQRAAGLLALMTWPGSAFAALDCADVGGFLAGPALGVVCFHSEDLRTNNTVTTPPDNSITAFANGTAFPGSSAGSGSFTPTKDRGVISNGPTPTPAPAAVPGLQVQGWFADDPSYEARFVLRFPDTWNGKLVVAGASGTRSEFNGDYAWSDYVLAKGYAYASQNKGMLNFWISSPSSLTQPASDPLACRVNPPMGALSTLWVHFYDNDAQKPFTQWTQYMLETAKLAQAAAMATYHHVPMRTYAVGTSNGGYQVRRAIETAPDLFDGGVDWEGTYISPIENILVDLPPAIGNFPAYVAANYDPNSAAAQHIRAAGYPPDIVQRDGSGNVTASLWKNYYIDFWEVTACQWQERFDPSYATYTAGLGNYDYQSRRTPAVAAAITAVTTTGKIKKPLITVAGTMDALLPIERQARAYEAAVNASHKGDNDERNAPYRLYEVQNGNHIEAYAHAFPALRVIQPHAQQAFDLLVAHVESNAPLPPSQCIPKDGTIVQLPTEPGNCANLYQP
ncbi:MAG TPA: 3-hydroxybutyrate oligomer hydrolase family protein [Casimicrobiaceae bacterium]|nr:3-hydroxybutyrate oligomer hydrolase family protein [Casimicrobiaceae bacterium]